MQQIQIIGNLGEDCQVRESNGRKFASFRVACTEKVREGSETRDITTWYSCTLNRPDSGVIPYLKKGVRVFVQGLPSYAIYDSATFRCKMVDVRVFVDKIQLCSDRKEEPVDNRDNHDVVPF